MPVATGVLLAGLVPLLYLTAALAPLGADQVAARWRLARATSALALISALGTGLSVLAERPPEPAWALVRLDGLTAVLLVLVTFLAAVVLRFSDRYLDGQPGRERYVRWLLGTIGAVAIVLVTNHLLILALAWTATSLALHRLLTATGERPLAVIAAHKKFLLSRVADVGILSAVVLVGETLGSYRIDELLARAAAMQTLPESLGAAGLLLALGVVIRTAQLPFHGWLIQVMEAPTPVSALLHAGVVNIGGFVLIRLAPLVSRLEAAQWLLVVAGTTTAVLATLVMATRVSVKVSLAWSTAAQMGFMLIECGLGAYSLALLHLVAHSLYKAHAFLGSGRTVVRAVRASLVAPTPSATPASWGAALVVSMGLAVAGALLLPAIAHDPVGLGLLALTALGAAPLVERGVRSGRALPAAHATAVAGGVLALYAGWHLLFERLAGPSLGAPGTPLRLGVVVVAVAALFTLVVLLSLRPGGRLARALYPACFAGFYLDEVFTRMTFALWPPRPTPVSVPAMAPPASRALEHAA